MYCVFIEIPMILDVWVLWSLTSDKLFVENVTKRFVDYTGFIFLLEYALSLKVHHHFLLFYGNIFTINILLVSFNS